MAAARGPDLYRCVATDGSLTDLEWLRENVHRHGCRYTADELLQRATGSPLVPEPFLEYARAKVDALYGVTP